MSVVLGGVREDLDQVPEVTSILREATDDQNRQRRLERALEGVRLRNERDAPAQALTDLQGTFLSVNASWCLLFGHPEAYFVGRSLGSLTVPPDSRRTDDLQDSLSRGLADTRRHRVVFRDVHGQSLGLLVDATTLRNGDGAAHSVALVAQRLTDPRSARGADPGGQRYGALAQRPWDAALVTDLDLHVVYAAPAAARILGFPPAALLGKPISTLVHPDDRSKATPLIQRVQQQPQLTERFLVRMRDSSDGWRWIEQTMTNCSLDPDVRGYVVSLRDFSEAVEGEQKLRFSEVLHRTIVETAQEGVLASAPDGKTMLVNDMLADILGLTDAEMQELDLHALLGGVTDSRARRVPVLDDRLAEPELEDVGPHLPSSDPSWERVVTGQLPRRPGGRGPVGGATPPPSTDGGEQTERYEVRYRHPDGRTRLLSVVRSRLRQEGAEPLGWLCMVSDVTDARLAENQLRRQALHDPLTSLPNRYLVLDRLKMAAARQQRTPERAAGVLFLDVDGFKPINDSAGHVAGDQLLREVAAVLTGSVRATDTVGRLGGDEFAILCEAADEEAVVRVASRIHDALRAPITLGELTARVTVSIGVAMSPPFEIADLIRVADGAMYDAKQLGGGTTVVARPTGDRQPAEGQRDSR